MNRIPDSFLVTPIHRAVLLGLPLVVGFVTPSLTLLAVQIIEGRVALGTAIADVLSKQFGQGHSLFILSLIGLIPFVVLVQQVGGYVRNRTRRACYALCFSGLIGILGLMVPAHAEVWYPLYGPGRMSSTAVIAFLFIPFFCIVTLILGLLIGRLITRAQWFQAFPVGHCQHCGYDLTGNLSGVCPECGHSTSS